MTQQPSGPSPEPGFEDPASADLTGHRAPDDEGIVRATRWTGIANEFTGVRVRKVWTPQGERLELVVPRTGYRILLDAMQLEVVAAQRPEDFSRLFARQLGSDEDGAL